MSEVNLFEERKFDRRVHYDERSRNFRTLAAVAAPRSYTWSCPVRLNQGNLGACVGFGWSEELASRPKMHVAVSNTTGFDLYDLAQTLDHWDDTPPEEGTSVLAGAKAAQQMGYLGEYRWCFSIDDLIRSVGNTGPVVMGTWWTSDMMSTDEKGFLEPTGSKVGGHCWLTNGVNIGMRYFKCVQSWGRSFGIDGAFYITFEAMEQLLLDEGEACVPTIRKWVSNLR